MPRLVNGVRAAVANTSALRLFGQYQRMARTELLDEAVRQVDRAGRPGSLPGEPVRRAARPRRADRVAH